LSSNTNCIYGGRTKQNETTKRTRHRNVKENECLMDVFMEACKNDPSISKELRKIEKKKMMKKNIAWKNSSLLIIIKK